MKKIFYLILALTVIFSVIPVSVCALVSGDWEIAVSNNEATIIGYTGNCTDKMTLPSEIGGFRVVGIGDDLQNLDDIFTENVTEIEFPEGFRFVSGNVLENLKDSLTRLTLPSTLEKFSSKLIDFSKLKEITIPSGVKEIGFMQFARCSSLEHVNLNEGLELIAGEAFEDCINLKEIKIPNTVTEIDQNAFSGCNSLTEIVIPDSVVRFGQISSGDTISVTRYSVIQNCANLETAVIGDGVSVIGSLELSNCPKLSSVYFGKSLKTINSYTAISSDPSLKTAAFAEGLERVGACAFKDCINLEAVIFPESVKIIEDFETMAYDGKPLPRAYVYGYCGSAAESFAAKCGFPFVDISVANPTDSKVLVDGKEVSFTAYNIGGNNYFKLRDVAFAINGSNKNFNVGWDGKNNAVSLNGNTPYITAGGELGITGASATKPSIANSKIYVDGRLTTFMAFNIADNNYVKLRDLGEVFNFGVDWDENAQTIRISTDKDYKN